MFNKHNFFREPRPERPFRKGEFKHIILHHLKDKPSCGYDIIRALEERFHGFYTPSPGAVYPTLQMLQEEGYVTAAEEDNKKVYTITDEGCQFLAEHKEFEKKMKSHLENWCNPENTDEIGETMREFRRLAHMLGDKVRAADTKKLERIRGIISRAYEDVWKE